MLHAVLMVGGAGTRFWPLGRRRAPKYLLPIVGTKSMLVQTVERIAPMVAPERILCITSRAQAPAIRRALPALPSENIIGEPMARDSAACVALGALIVHERDPAGVMLCMPGDNLVHQSARFRACVRTAERVARAGRLVTFGVKPIEPETRFGYIHRGRALGGFGRGRVFEVRRFTEKPDFATARRMLKSGEYYWNSGNFVWRADVILAQFAEHAPEIHNAMERLRPAIGTRRELAALRREYRLLPRISIDYAVMEKARNVAVVEAEFDWDDVGSWTALERHHRADAGGNTILGRAAILDCRDCIVATDERNVIGAIGMRDVIIVHTRDATLVCPKSRANEVKQLVELLERLGHRRHL